MPVGTITTGDHWKLLLRLRARLTTGDVVANDQRLPIEQHRLQPTVWACDRAHLLAKPAEVEQHQRGNNHHDAEADWMLGG
jgi:hypothetical protein